MSVVLRRRGIISTKHTSGPALPAPIAAYGFNEGTGLVAADSSGNGHDLTLYGGDDAPLWAPGPGATSAIFEGYSGNIGNGAKTPGASSWFDPTLPWSMTFQAFSALNYGNPGQIRAFASASMYAPSAFTIGIQQEMFRIQAPGAATVVCTPPPADYEWHYYGVTYDGTTVIGYVDGIEAGSGPGGGFNPIGASLPIYLNYPDRDDGDYTDDTAFDNWRIFDLALDSATVLAYMTIDV